MKKHQKIIGLGIFYACLVIGNIIPVIIHWEDAQITKYSVPAIIVMALVIVNGIFAYFFRHKDNYLIFRRHSLSAFSSDKDYAYSEEYRKRFFGMLELYCAAIPFYIPLIFLLTDYVQTLWVLVVLGVPQIVFIIQQINDTMKEAKEAEFKRKQQEEELKEQQRREELGYRK